MRLYIVCVLLLSGAEVGWPTCARASCRSSFFFREGEVGHSTAEFFFSDGHPPQLFFRARWSTTQPPIFFSGWPSWPTPAGWSMRSTCTSVALEEAAPWPLPTKVTVGCCLVARLPARQLGCRSTFFRARWPTTQPPIFFSGWRVDHPAAEFFFRVAKLADPGRVVEVDHLCGSRTGGGSPMTFANQSDHRVLPGRPPAHPPTRPPGSSFFFRAAAVPTFFSEGVGRPSGRRLTTGTLSTLSSISPYS